MTHLIPALSPETAPPTHRAKDFFLARQPILNRDQDLYAYELLFRSAKEGPANVTDDLSATASVIAHAADLGMENVIGASLAFINVDATVLMNDFIHFLPRHKVVLEILETVEVTDKLAARVQELVRAGYTFALDDVVADSNGLQMLLPFVDIIKVDITEMNWDMLAHLGRQFKQAGKTLLAEKVEGLEQFQRCLDIGFDYFQGYYFARPTILSGRKLSPSQVAIMQVMTQLMSEADLADIERSIKQDASLGLGLLRLVNAPSSTVTRRIDSLSQALQVLGRHHVQRWLQILLYAEPGKLRGATSPLLILATTRGKLLELMAEKVRPGDHNMANIAFTVGIMSLMDALFAMPMEDILKQLLVVDDVRNALLFRSGVYGDMLRLAECIEQINTSGPLLAPLLKRLQLTTEQLYALQLAAFEWSDTVSNNAN